MFGHPYIYYNSPLKARTDFLNESLTNMDPGGPLWGIERPFVLNGSLPRKPLHEGHLTCLDRIFLHKVDMRGQHPVAFKSCLLASGLVKSKHLV